MPSSPRVVARKLAPVIVEQIVLFALIVGCAFAAMDLISLPPTNVTAIWLPAGIALVALLRPAGWLALPTILLANWAVIALANAYPFLSFRPFSLLLCVVNTAGPAIGSLVWRRWLKADPYQDGAAFLKFTFGVALLPAVLTAWGVIVTIHAAGFLPGLTAGQFWIRTSIITVSDALGVFLVAPFVLAPWEDGFGRGGLTPWLTHAVVVLAAGGVCWLSGHLSAPLVYLATPLALLAAIGCGARGVALTVLIVSVYGLHATSLGHGPFAADAEKFGPIFAMATFAFCLGLPGQFAGITLRQLRRHQRELEDQVRARTQALLEAKDAAEAADRAKSEFLAVMSHEIRTPLNGVLGFARLMESTRLDDQQREFMDAVRSSGEMLLGLLNNILDFSKIAANAIELEAQPFDLSRTVADLARTFVAPAEKKHLALTCRVDPSLPHRLVGDVTRIRQVLSNLVSNAVKFTERGSIAIEVTAASLTKPEGNAPARWTVRMAVRDSGIGIAPEQTERLFRSFSQADSSITRRYGGSGLGLAISRRLCVLMGGSLEVTSERGVGSTFVAKFTLPEPGATRAAAASLPSAPEEPPQRPLRVLVAEDNLVNRRLVEAMLTRLGHEAEFAHNGREAVEQAQAVRFDVILMDVQMPEVDGISATRQIRADEAARSSGHVPIIAVTADATVEDRDRCLRAGMDDYLVKPIDLERFRAALRRATAT